MCHLFVLFFEIALYKRGLFGEPFLIACRGFKYVHFRSGLVPSVNEPGLHIRSPRARVLAHSAYLPQYITRLSQRPYDCRLKSPARATPRRLLS